MTPAPLVLWLTGLPCSGKSTVAALVTEALGGHGLTVRLLDGDALRRTLSSDLGFSPEARVEQARRAAHVAQEALDAGEFPVVAVISPSHEAREAARAVLGEAMAVVHVDAPVAICEARDVKGMYARARRGELADFTGVSAPYDAPADPALHLDTEHETPAESARRVVELVRARAALPAAAVGRAAR
jgi:adenylyl-sulfate kinase